MESSRSSPDNTQAFQKFSHILFLLGFDSSLKEGDVVALTQYINPEAAYVLAEANMDLLIRLFFPRAQLSQPLLDFIKKIEIIIRSEKGIFKYQHGVTTTCHEIKLSFFKLFLLVYYGVYFRKFEQETDSHTGEWHQLANYFTDELSAADNIANAGYDIKIIPPGISDISYVLEMIPILGKVSAAFSLASLSQNLCPIMVGTFQNLEVKIQNSLAFLLTDLVLLIQSSYTEAPLNKSPIREFQNEIYYLSPSFLVRSYSDNKMSGRVSSDENAKNIVLGIIKNFSFEYAPLFSVGENVVKIKNPIYLDHSTSSSLPSKVLVTIYNIFLNLSFILLPRDHSFLVEHSNYKVYTGTSQDDSSSPLLYWIVNILLSFESLTMFAKIEFSLNKILELIKHGQVSEWNYDIPACEISFDNFIQFFNCEVIKTVLIPCLHNFQRYNLSIQEVTRLASITSKDLLENLLQTNYSLNPFQGLFIHKINFLVVKKYHDTLMQIFNCQDSPNSALMKIWTATRVVKGKSVNIASDKFQDCSGIVLVAPPGGCVPIVLFKTQTAGETLKIKKHAMSFPLGATYQSNSAYLQGIRIINKKIIYPEIFVNNSINYAREDNLLFVLQNRHGNVPAIYANVAKPNGEPNPQGIFEAVLIYDFIFHYFSQELNFVLYDDIRDCYEIVTFDEYKVRFIDMPEDSPQERIVQHALDSLVNFKPVESPGSTFSARSLTTSVSPPIQTNSIGPHLTNPPTSSTLPSLTEQEELYHSELSLSRTNSSSSNLGFFNMPFSPSTGMSPIPESQKHHYDPSQLHRSPSLDSLMGLSKPSVFNKPAVLNDYQSMQTQSVAGFRVCFADAFKEIKLQKDKKLVMHFTLTLSVETASGTKLAETSLNYMTDTLMLGKDKEAIIAFLFDKKIFTTDGKELAKVFGELMTTLGINESATINMGYRLKHNINIKELKINMRNLKRVHEDSKYDEHAEDETPNSGSYVRAMVSK